MTDGVIVKALSGFYYVQEPDGLLACRGRGKLRREGVSPMVGDRVSYTRQGQGGVGYLVNQLLIGEAEVVDQDFQLFLLDVPLL